MKLSKAARYASIGLQGMAIRLFSKEAGSRHIARKLAEIPGVPTKIGQLLAMKSEMSLPNVQVLEPEIVLNLIESQTPLLFRDLLEIDEQAQVASLSQVHCAKLRDGRRVAIKVQFPNIAEEMDEQIENAFHAFSKYGPAKNIDFDLNEFKSFFKTSLLNELDYRSELLHQQRFFDFFKMDDRIIIPKVYSEYSSSTILTQSYESSMSMEHLSNFGSGIKSFISTQLVRFQFESIFKLRLLHGDLHSGNWGFDVTRNAVVFYDFGSTQDISSDQVESFLSLIRLSSDASEDEYFQAWNKLGFDAEKLHKISPQLKSVTAIITEPFKNQQWKVGDWNFSKKIMNVLGNEKWLFRLAGPPWFLGLMRSCHGVVHALHQLDAQLKVSEIFTEVTGEMFRYEQQVAVKDEEELEVCSHFLKVKICENDIEMVSLEFPAKSAAILAELIPNDAKNKIEKAGYLLSKIAKNAIDTRFAPQVLFDIKISDRSYRVWLE